MKKAVQLEINEKVDKIFDEVLQCSELGRFTGWERLRTCQAWVCKLDRFYILKSYGTVIAVIDTRTDTCYDFLRQVYGYTATSAQHIAKFRNDYGAGKCGCVECLTWREV